MPPKGENPYTRCAESVSCIYWRVRPGPKGPGFLPLLYSKKEGRTTQFLLRMNSRVSLRHTSMIDPSSISGLPLTGGMGTKLLYIFGAALIAIGIAAYLRKKK